MLDRGIIYLKRTGEKVSISESSSASEAELIYATTEITKRELPAVEADIISVFNNPAPIEHVMITSKKRIIDYIKV